MTKHTSSWGYGRSNRSSSETCPLSAQDLSPTKSSIKHLHTGNASAEISPVTNTSPHPYGVVSSQIKSTNISACCEPVIDKQLCSPRPSAVSCTNKLPTLRSHGSAHEVSTETASSTARKTYKQRSSSSHPEVNAPAIWHVVENGSGISLVVDPRQEGDRSLRV